MKEFFRPLNLSQNLIEYDWILWPIEQIWTGSDSLGAFSEGKWRFLDKWHAELWRTLQVLTFQAKPGKEFNWILDFTKDLEFNFTFAQWILVPQTMLNEWPNKKLANLITILGPFLHFFLTIYHSVEWSIDFLILLSPQPKNIQEYRIEDDWNNYLSDDGSVCIFQNNCVYIFNTCGSYSRVMTEWAFALIKYCQTQQMGGGTISVWRKV